MNLPLLICQPVAPPGLGNLRRPLLLLSALALLGTHVDSAAAQATYQWINTSNAGSFFHTAGNWDPAFGPPTPTDTALFDSPGAYEVWWDSSSVLQTPSVYYFDVQNGQVRLLSTDAVRHELLINAQAGPLTFGLTIAGAGTSVTIDGIHLHSLGDALIYPDAMLTVDGSPSEGSRFSVDGSFGLAIEGSLDVVAGGEVSSSGGSISFFDNSGVVTVADPNSTWTNAFGLIVGEGGDGALNILNGGAVSNTFGVIGLPSNSTSSVTVDGVGSSWGNASTLTVGSSGSGELIVSGGGAVSNTTGSIGDSPGSSGEVTVVGLGSTWHNSSDLTVGRQGSGELNIDAGGVVTNYSAYLGDESDGVGMVTVSGAGSQWNNAFNLVVGDQGSGFLTINSGGQVSAHQVLIGYGPGASGALLVSGSGTGNTASSMSVGNVVNVGLYGNGSLEITDGGAITTSIGNIAAAPGSSGTATISGVDPNGSPSTWMNNYLSVGGDTLAASGGQALLTIENQGRVAVLNTLKLWGAGAVVLNGGSLETGQFDNTSGGTFSFLSGSLTINEGITIGGDPSGVFPGSATLDSDHHLLTSATTTIAPFRTLTLDGGLLETGDIVVDGAVDFLRGTLRITGAGGLTIGPAGPFGDSLLIGAGRKLEVLHTLAVDSGASLSLASGGSVAATSLANRGVLQGSGSISASLDNQVGGQVRVQAGERLVLTNPAHSNDGSVQLQTGRLDVRGVLTNGPSGDILGRGTLSTTVGLINQGDLALSNGQSDIFGDVSNNTTGRVMVSGHADVTFWGDVSHTGQVFNVASGSSVTFFGAAGFGVSGAGDVFFEADITPGNSPGLETFGGDVHLGVLANLEIEIAGTVKGDDYDSLVVAGEAALGGALDVSLFPSYPPTPGDTFEILTADGGVTGAFTALDLPDLGLLALHVYYEPTAVILAAVPRLSGDYNVDGVVDAADYSVWRDSLGEVGIGLVADGNRDGWVSQIDYQIWRSHYGETLAGPGESAQANVPEPPLGALLFAAAAALNLRSRFWHAPIRAGDGLRTADCDAVSRTPRR
ncbi:MAG: hypothetical protein KDA37_11780 [Planctomycetales bacterium]|nr:hypothetical protein [Planctomycetales bacterium]